MKHNTVPPPPSSVPESPDAAPATAPVATLVPEQLAASRPVASVGPAEPEQLAPEVRDLARTVLRGAFAASGRPVAAHEDKPVVSASDEAEATTTAPTSETAEAADEPKHASGGGTPPVPPGSERPVPAPEPEEPNGEGSDIPETLQGAPIVIGQTISTVEGEQGEHGGVPSEIARAVQQQITEALEERNIDPDSVLFSGYHGRTESVHDEKAAGDWGDGGFAEGEVWTPPYESTDGYGTEFYEDTAGYADASAGEGESDGHTYFFGDHASLADGAGGPVSYAGPEYDDPVISVYDRQVLEQHGLDQAGDSITTTPDVMKEALLFSYLPTYSPMPPERAEAPTIEQTPFAVPPNMTDLLDTGLRPAPEDRPGTYKQLVEGHPNLVVQTSGDFEGEAADVVDALPTLRAYGVNVPPAVYIEHEGTEHVVTEVIEGARHLDELLGGYPTEETLAATQQNFQKIADYFFDQAARGEPTLAEITSLELYAQGRVPSTDESRLWLEDVPTHLIPPESYGTQVENYVDAVLQAEELTGRRFHVARMSAIRLAEQLNRLDNLHINPYNRIREALAAHRRYLGDDTE